MKRRRIADVLGPVLDVVLLPFAAPAAVVLKGSRRIGFHRLRLCRSALLSIGVIPIRRHYHEPFLAAADLRHSLDQERELPGIAWNVEEQLAFLSSLRYAEELNAPARIDGAERPNFASDAFGPGDSEYLYQIVREKKPRKVLEIGSGYSTRIARAAIERNRGELPGYACEHICIEPYEAPWLESLGVTVLRKRVEDVDSAIFSRLERNDLLFIDSSHIIRPQGDVVLEYLEILPRLASGVIVHVHDVFSPRDYPADWLLERLLLWNEQYLLEAFLTNNEQWKVIGALNLLKHRHFDALKRVCPFLTQDHEPGSFYIQRV